MKQIGATPHRRLLGAAMVCLVTAGCDWAGPSASPSPQSAAAAHASTLDFVEFQVRPIARTPATAPIIPIAHLPDVDKAAVALHFPSAVADHYTSNVNVRPVVTASVPQLATTDGPCGECEPRTQDQSGSGLTPDQAAAYAVAPKRDLDVEVEAAPLAGPTKSTPELVAIARQADSHITRGLLLAERGAIYSARAEFLQALRLSAAALDSQRNTNAHSRALARGFRALEETKDLARAATATVDGIPAAQALQHRLGYAQEQLAGGGGDLQPAASALFALGKLEMTSALTKIGSPEAARAAVYFQAALQVNPRHALAANELGVLLARHGRINEAKAALQYSARIAPQPAVWRNLAIIHHGMGELELAASADRQYQHATSAVQNSATSDARPNVVWVDPATFAAGGRFNAEAPAVAAAVSAGAPPSTAAHRNGKSAAAPSTRSSAKR